jgi:hypothetical protein
MSRTVVDRQPLFDAWLPWEELPEPVRQQVVDLLAILYLNTLEPSCEKPHSNDASHD